MIKNALGKTGLNVSRLCFGSLTMGPLQAGFDPAEAGEILAFAFDRGVNFVDMAQLYGVYPYVREALRRTKRDDIVLCSKTYAYERDAALEAVEEALLFLRRADAPRKPRLSHQMFGIPAPAIGKNDGHGFLLLLKLSLIIVTRWASSRGQRYRSSFIYQQLLT